MERKKINLDYIDKAEEKIEKDRVLDAVEGQPKQFQITLMAIINKINNSNSNLFTGDIYEEYNKLCNECGLRALTQRRVGDILAEFDMLGIINATVISKGRYGRTREIKLSIPKNLVNKIQVFLKNSLGLN